jgi:hypothetical protein
MAAQEVGRMSESGILKTLIVYLLIGCFLISNVSCTYASSEVSVDFYDSMTEPSEEKIQHSQEEVQNSEEKSEPSEDTGMQTSENDELKTENTNVKLSDDKDAQSPENAEEEPTEETEINSSENSETEFTEEMEENKTSSTENNETVSSENSEAQSSEDTQVQTEDTETQTSGEPQGSEDMESESSYHTGNSYNTWNSYHIEYSEHTKIEDNKYIQSEPAQKTVSENSGPAENSKPAPPSASVDLHGEKTQVFSGEDILLRLSAVNLITKPVMHVQVIIIPPSGMSVSSSVFVQSGAGQYTTTYELEPGKGRDIEVRIETNQPGDFKVKGRVIYYFGEDKENIEDHTLDLPIQVKEKPYAVKESLPGFTLASLIFVLIGAFILKRR